MRNHCTLGKYFIAVLAAMQTIAGFSPVLAHGLADNRYTQTGDTMLYLSADAKKSESDLLATYQKIPFDVQVQLAEDDCRIYVCSASENGGFLSAPDLPAGAYTGMYTEGSAQYIDLLSDYAVTGPYRLWHEVGHYVSRNGNMDLYNLSGRLAQTSAWVNIYAAEAGGIGLYSAYAARNVYSAEECFATAFSLYIGSPDSLKKLAPSAYEYIEDVLDGYESINPCIQEAASVANDQT